MIYYLTIKLRYEHNKDDSEENKTIFPIISHPFPWPVTRLGNHYSYHREHFFFFLTASLLVVQHRWKDRVYSTFPLKTAQTYPRTLLWETFAAPAAVSSSTGAAVLLPTLSDTKTDMIVRAGRVEVSAKHHISTKLQRFEMSTCLVQTQICAGCVCLSCGACWDTVGGELLYTVCVTNCVFVYCGPLVSTCLCNTLWCMSVEHSDAPEYTAAWWRMEARMWLHWVTVDNSEDTIV